MRTVRLVTAVLSVLMAIVILAGFAAGNFGDEGSEILGLAWGRVTLIDLYVGLVLFGGWIVVRERGKTTLPWLIALVVLGNLAAAVYALKASLQSRSLAQFLTGQPE